MREITKEEREIAFAEVFGAAVEANKKYGLRREGQPYEKQIRKGKTKKDKKAAK